MRTLIIALAAAALLHESDPASAQSAATPFYRGKTITIVVGTSAGGGYDAYARLLQRYLGRHLPGEPTILVSNMPGAGGEQAASYVAKVAPKDGTFIAAAYADQPLDPILGDASKINYDPSRLNYLGSAVSDDYVCMVRPDSPATTFEDMLKTPVIMGATAPNSASGYIPVLLNNTVGAKFKMVFGYPGAREVTMAIQKGEINGACIGWLSVKSLYPYLVKNGEVKLVVQEIDKGLPELDKMGVPVAGAWARDERTRKVLEIVNAQEVFARPFFVAEETPADRVETLRRALSDTWRDPDLLAEAAKANLDVAPRSAEEVQALVQKIYASPPDLLKSAKEAIQAKDAASSK